MRYMMLIHHDEAALAAAPPQELYAEFGAFNQALAKLGGESGPGARPMAIEWAREIRDQCAAQGVAFFFKQWGGIRPKTGGRNLDGREWNELPMPVASRAA